MKYLIPLTLFVLITLCSCRNSSNPTPPEKDIPRSLAQQDGSF